jgi:hypothetical protein
MSHIGLVGRWDDRRKTAALVELRSSIGVHALTRDRAFLEHAVTELRIPGIAGQATIKAVSSVMHGDRGEAASTTHSSWPGCARRRIAGR